MVCAGTHTVPGSSEGFVCGSSDEVSVLKWRGNSFSSYQATNVSHVCQQVRV